MKDAERVMSCGCTPLAKCFLHAMEGAAVEVEPTPHPTVRSKPAKQKAPAPVVEHTAPAPTRAPAKELSQMTLPEVMRQVEVYRRRRDEPHHRQTVRRAYDKLIQRMEAQITALRGGTNDE